MEQIEPVAITISELTHQIKNAIEQEPELQSVWVRGEISNFKRHTSGHLYFNLKDENSQIRAVMFNRYAAMVRAPIQDGLEVLALGSVSVYEKRGEYQLYVTALRAAGLGALHLEFERLKAKLEAEGLFDPARKRPIIALPRRIAVVTSPTGAAVRDVVNIITRRFPAVELTIVPSLVQGDEAPAALRRALARAALLRDVDTILLVRGGGSIEDLWAFNDEKLARDIAACPVPVISGVGHETDFTIADFVADMRAPTPSAAAERAAPEFAALRQDRAQAARRLLRATRNRVLFEKQRLHTFAAALSARNMKNLINQRRQTIDDLTGAMQMRLLHKQQTSRQQLHGLGLRLHALDPMGVLGRGYAVLKNTRTQKLITSTAGAKQGDEIDAVLKDGRIRSVVIQKYGSKQTPGGGELDL